MNDERFKSLCRNAGFEIRFDKVLGMHCFCKNRGERNTVVELLKVSKLDVVSHYLKDGCYYVKLKTEQQPDQSKKSTK